MEGIVRAAILLDTLSVAASTVYAAHPDRYINVGAVPTHVTTCLAEMLTAYGSLPDMVDISQGDASGKTVGISIEPAVYFESCSDALDNEFYTPQPGAQKCKIGLIVKGIRTKIDPTLTKNVGLRLMYILDNDNRSIEGNTYMAQRSTLDMDTSSDNTVLNPQVGGYFKMTWKRSDGLTVGEWASVFFVEFVRNFG